MRPPFTKIWPHLQQSRLVPLIGLPVIIALYATLVFALHPANLFGLIHDDSLYFSSAKALAEGRGYILPSLLGTPAATKYPVLYSLILSAIWKLNPSFPANVIWAVCLNLVIGSAFICFSYLFCRNCLGLGRLSALLVTAFCGLHGLTVFYSALLMSDVLFAALVLGSFLLIAQSVSADNWTYSCGAGLVAGLACLCRTAGLPLVGGILVYFVVSRMWKRAGAFCAGCLPVLAANALLLRTAKPIPPVSFSPEFPGWIQTWHYYTSYEAFRALDSPTISLKLSFFMNQVLYLIAAIPGYLLSPLSEANIALWLIATLGIFVLAVAGIASSIRAPQARPAFAALVCYTAVLLAWDFPDWERFLLPFLPLFAAVIGNQAFAWGSSAWRIVKSRQDLYSRSLATAGLAFLGLVSACTAVNFLHTSRTAFFAKSRERGDLQRERLQAYDWLRTHTKPEETLIANDDVVTFLYTGRQTITPISPLPAGLYDPSRRQKDLAHFWDTAHVLGASYWLTDNDEQVGGLKGLRVTFLARIRESQGVLPIAFEGGGSWHVRVQDLTCVRDPGRGECATIAPVLFPELHGEKRPIPEPQPVHNR
jgi:hypothetical protein